MHLTVEAKIRLVRLQLAIKQQHLEPNQIQAFLDQQLPENQDPYTEKPVQYDRDNNSLVILPFGRKAEKIEIFL